MSKFRVGQRVRIKWSRTWPWLAGRTGIIVGMANPALAAPGHNCDWLVTPEGFDSPLLPDPEGRLGKSRFAPHSDQLEPATDCYDKTEWDACVWKPEHLRVGA